MRGEVSTRNRQQYDRRDESNFAGVHRFAPYPEKSGSNSRRRFDPVQASLVMREMTQEKEEVLLDPGTLDPDGHTTIDWFYPSQDGNLIAYGISKGNTAT